nr:hypothetical protein [Staphylococcus epidermidis]
MTQHQTIHQIKTPLNKFIQHIHHLNPHHLPLQHIHHSIPLLHQFQEKVKQLSK